jgi:hypothetical protein
MAYVEPEQAPLETDSGVVLPPEPARRPRLSGMSSMLGIAAMMGAHMYYPGFGPCDPFGGGSSSPKRYRRGPCRVCGKPDVAAGRQRGVYLCGEHLHLEHEAH